MPKPRIQSDGACHRWFAVLVFSSSFCTAIGSSAQDVSCPHTRAQVTVPSAIHQTVAGASVSSGEEGRVHKTMNARDGAVVTGTVLDSDGALVPGATVVIKSAVQDSRSARADQNGVFEFTGLQPAISYVLHVNAVGFAAWTSQPITLDPGQRLSVTEIALRIESEASVTVSASRADIASAQLRFEEQQRILGFIPNFYVAYDGENAVSLTSGMKFQLAFKVASNPVTAAGVAFIAGVDQAAHTPNYQLGARGYGQRLGATAATGLSDILIGGALLPSVLHQDPRYFYQGTGTKRSRIAHALLSPFVARGDDGHNQINFASMGGDLGSSALQEAYVPASNRGLGGFVGSLVLGTGERAVSNLAQEFIVPRFTSKGGHRP